jgi:quercetin dioxygenase-like cupin family protein
VSENRVQQEVESGVLAFRRECIQEGVHLARIAIRPGETSTPHYHPVTRDVFYVMAGVLTVTVEVPADATTPLYDSLAAAMPKIVPTEAGTQIHTIRLEAGEILAVNPPAVHCTSNAGDEPCSFLCIEGIGEYQFVPAGPALAPAG